MEPTVDPRHTAIRRSELSKPVRLGVEEGLVSAERSFFDYGCGLGDDIERLTTMGVDAAGWDPGHRPGAEVRSADVVNLGFVLNVLEKRGDRAQVLRKAWALARSVFIVAARLTHDRRRLEGSSSRDGVVTRRGTFQKFFDQSELRALIQDTLGQEALAAAPGVFVVFRDEALKEAYLAKRQRRRASAPQPRKSDLLFEEHREILDPLMEFFAARGRLPGIDELGVAEEIEGHFGSLRRAFAVVRRVTSKEEWETLAEQRRQDHLTYLALARLSGRPRFGKLPAELQRDVRAFCGTYAKACSAADEILFSAGNLDAVHEITAAIPLGKRTPDSFYIHISALESLPSILRVYEGCARHYVGHVDDANLIKLHRHRSQVSYLSYPKFERDPHPALAESLVIALDTLKIRWTDYSERENPPILHRKETFLEPSNPLHERFARLTLQEERRGLLEETSTIGTREGWNERLRQHGVRMRGHRLVRDPGDS